MEQFLRIAQKYQLEGLTHLPGQGTVTEEVEEGEIKLERSTTTTTAATVRKEKTEDEKVSSVVSSNTDTSPSTEVELKKKMSENVEIRADGSIACTVCGKTAQVIYIQHFHWSKPYIAALSLVKSCKVSKYVHALKGPIIDDASN